MIMGHLFGFKKQKVSIKMITVDQAYEGIESGAFILVDVRRDDEWINTGRPKGSYGVPLQSPDFISQISQLVQGDKGAAIAVSCGTGGRSLQGSNRLVDEGFTRIFNVEGGFLEWKCQGLPIDESPFDDV